MNIVVVGYGMVGSRFVEELCAITSPESQTLHITVLGAEHCDPYNRVLLSEVVAGAYDVAAITMPTIRDPRVHIRQGVTATRINRDQRTVTDSNGNHHPYDALVLATGATARIPTLPGITHTPPGTGEPGDTPPEPSLIPGVHVLRTIDDAREIVAATLNAPAAIVLGGGVLGIEVAVGLAGRGLAVDLVHPRALMNAQLDAPASAVATTMLNRRGITVRTGTAATAATTHPTGRITGLQLADNTTITAPLLIITAGTTPNTTLAHTANLPTDHGILVTNNLNTTTDPHIYAIGDCAQPPEGCTGLIAPGWDQARHLAATLHHHTTINTPTPRHDPHDIVTVKGAGIDIVTMGISGTRQPPPCDTHPRRTIQLSDPDAGRHLSIIIENGRLIGATCIGAGPIAADLTTTYTNHTPLPRDPAQLLLRPLGPAATTTTDSPVRIPDRATICRCNGVTKGDLISAWNSGARSTADFAQRTRATTGCGGCTEAVCGIADWLRASASQDTPGEGEAAAQGQRKEATVSV
ncbi:FAD-dependent oxidoreductase [Jonesia quinghaiensis]|uniref:FAD-dependent oxidoreductase n=1 Tax=Jonesia quinghaiensis TaxID=262806 RepID=UPI00042202BD|nr:FAD-dependent oxidoreductase [Jonesia quinghaiensis]